MHPFVCLACGKGFKYEHSLNFHIKSYHGSSSSSNTNNNVTSSPSTTALSMTGKIRSRSITSSTSSPPSPPVSSSLRVKNEMECLESSQSLEDRLVINMEGRHASCATPSFKERGIANRLRYENTTSVDDHVSENASDVYDLTSRTGVSLPSAGHEGMSSSSSETSSQNDFGFAAKVSSKGIQIKSEKALISVMEGVHTQSDQTYILYKCCLCGHAFPSLEPILAHMQSMHSNQNNLTCEKCGASFRWKSELQLHEQLHKAMDSSQVTSPQQQGHHQAMTVFPSKSTDSSKSKAQALTSSNNHSMKSPSVESFQNSFHNLVMFPHPFLSTSGDKNFSMESLVNPDNMSILSSLMQQHNANDMKNLQDNGKSVRKSHVDDSRVTRSRDTFSEQVLNLSRSHAVKVSEKQDLRESGLKRSSHEVIDYRTTTGGSVRTSPDRPSDRPVKMMKQQDILMKGNPPPSGEIEEIAPGQFKCRYCDKTFDRVFSVHRHERVHTGFKPCICKVCGRGFSEKRNLRHHIIRFHSDGSGRELLKRARKDKALAASAKHLAASVMIGDHAFPLDVRVPLNHVNQSQHQRPQSEHLQRSLSSQHLRHKGSSTTSSSSPGGLFSPSDSKNHHKHDGSRERNELDDKKSWRQEESEDEELLVIATPDHRHDHTSNSGSCEPRPVLKTEEQLLDESTRQEHESSSPPSTSSSRRRKGKPSKKILVNSNHATEDEDDDHHDNEEQQRHPHTKRSDTRDEEHDWQDDDNHHQYDSSSKKSTSNRDGEDFADEEEMMSGDDDASEVMTGDHRPVSRSKSDGNFSESDSNSNGGNHSENSLEINLNSAGKNRGHGAFFSSYSPRLGIVEKPIKRNEVCRPMLGPDGKYLYPCGYCSKTFCSLSDLNRHMNFHEDVRPFKCEYCDYQSRTNSQLKVHMMRHAGIKQYLCQTCNYNGVTQSDLNRHSKTRSHILRSGNVCALCSLGFSTSMLLKDHLEKFHDMDSPTDSMMRSTSVSPPVCDLSVTKGSNLNTAAVNCLANDTHAAISVHS